ncbi:CoA transferase [Streptomyces sp. NPDC127092]|uniref:CoA transferase n=1 Tax=Streptomyces sp. NPDC127092 TaxID=3347135 RepID=UPI00365B81E9
MASPATTHTTAARRPSGRARPLDGLVITVAGPAALTGTAADHLRRLGAVDPRPASEREGENRAGADPASRAAGAGEIVLGGDGFAPVTAATAWGAAGSGIEDEATAQAATGVMAVHGRRYGAPRGLGVDYLATATGVLAAQGLLAALVGQARGVTVTATARSGGRPPGTAVSTGAQAARVTASADRAGLLAVSQYLAAACADEPEAVESEAGGPAPGGPVSDRPGPGDPPTGGPTSRDLAPGRPAPVEPPFTSADGVLFELETLDAGAWAVFWRELRAPADAIRAGWRPFQFRYATACAPLPDALHQATRRHTWQRVRQAAAAVGATGATGASAAAGIEVCRLRTLAERAREDDGADPWHLRSLGAGRTALGVPPAPGLPLAGVTVLEAGRRIQAPLATHLLGLLGARVIRIEPPGGDPLRGMPPTCAGVSARWLALNRGKEAAEFDIKSPADRRRLRELAAEADVFLHNWAPGKAAALELDAEHLTAVNPSLVYAYTGGWAGRLDDAPMGTDFMVQARTAVGEAVHPAGEPPVPSLMTLLDVLGGLHGAEAVLAGLLLRERTGRGVRVDSSLLGAADTLLAPALRRAAAGADPRPPAGFRHPLRTSDGWIAPTDACARAAAAYDLRGMCAEDALDQLRAHGLTATAVTTDLSALHLDPRLSGPIGRDAHGAPAVPEPWSFA